MKNFKTQFQKILGHLRRADQRFGLIQNGDRIAIGLSGGKDSLLLLKALAAYRTFGVKEFELVAITVDCTGGKADFSKIAVFCAEHQIKYIIEPSNIFQIIFDLRKEKSPCSLCSKLRRGMLNSTAKKEHCNKVALGHHGDDLIETFFLSLLYEGRINSFAPKSYLDKTGITVIRPFVFVTEQEIMAFQNILPVLENTCPINHRTQREYMKKLVSKLNMDIPYSRMRMLNAVIEFLFDTPDNLRDT